MTLQQLRDKIDAAIASGLSMDTPVKVGSDWDGKKTLVDRDVLDAEPIVGRSDFPDSFVLYREV